VQSDQGTLWYHRWRLGRDEQGLSLILLWTDGRMEINFSARGTDEGTCFVFLIQRGKCLDYLSYSINCNIIRERAGEYHYVDNMDIRVVVRRFFGQFLVASTALLTARLKLLLHGAGQPTGDIFF